MKRLLALTLTLITLLALLGSLASCAKIEDAINNVIYNPELDIHEAKRALILNGYTVNVDTEYLSGYVVVRLDAYRYDEKKLTYDSLVITEYCDEKIAETEYEYALLDYKVHESHRELLAQSYENFIAEDEYYLNNHGDELSEDSVNAIMEEINSQRKAVARERSDLIFGQSGCFVWSGTKNGIKDSK